MSIFKKILGIVLMSIPVWIIFWMLGKIINGGIWEGFILFLTTVLMIVEIGAVFVFMLVVAQIGWKLYKGEKIG